MSSESLRTREIFLIIQTQALVCTFNYEKRFSKKKLGLNQAGEQEQSRRKQNFQRRRINSETKHGKAEQKEAYKSHQT
jgi:hypothetical protein